MDNLAGDILTFWFEDTQPSQWWTQSDAFDAEIRRRFEAPSVQAAADLKQYYPHILEGTPEGHLALILMFDQFPRNMYRGTRGAFAWDSLALEAARRAVDKGRDLKIPQGRRQFVYMPFMHAEDMAAQEEGLYYFESRLNDENTLFHAQAHANLIRKFGRFPHRNEVLGRESTGAEVKHLKEGGYTP